MRAQEAGMNHHNFWGRLMIGVILSGLISTLHGSCAEGQNQLSTAEQEHFRAEEQRLKYFPNLCAITNEQKIIEVQLHWHDWGMPSKYKKDVTTTDEVLLAKVRSALYTSMCYKNNLVEHGGYGGLPDGRIEIKDEKGAIAVIGFSYMGFSDPDFSTNFYDLFFSPMLADTINDVYFAGTKQYLPVWTMRGLAKGPGDYILADGEARAERVEPFQGLQSLTRSADKNIGIKNVDFHWGKLGQDNKGGTNPGAISSNDPGIMKEMQSALYTCRSNFNDFGPYIERVGEEVAWIKIVGNDDQEKTLGNQEIIFGLTEHGFTDPTEYNKTPYIFYSTALASAVDQVYFTGTKEHLPPKLMKGLAEGCGQAFAQGIDNSKSATEEQVK
jgi:hypothetical protein